MVTDTSKKLATACFRLG